VNGLKEQSVQTIWKDRKRILGLPWTFTKYRVQGNRLYVSNGLFSTSEDELLLYRVLDIKVKRTLGNKIFGMGTIILYTADKTDAELHIQNIKNPREVRDLLSKMVEEERIRLDVVGREMVGTAGEDIDSMDGHIE